MLQKQGMGRSIAVQETQTTDVVRRSSIARAFDARRGGAAIVYVILMTIIVFAAIVSPPFLGRATFPTC